MIAGGLGAAATARVVPCRHVRWAAVNLTLSSGATGRVGSGHLDAQRTARLLLDDGSSDATPVAAALTPQLLDAVAVRRVPSTITRLRQSATKSRSGPAAFARDVDAGAALRRALLGDRAQAPPRFLVRVDEFPHYLAWDDPARFGSDGYRRFHEIMHTAGVPYLIAALPRVSRRPLDPDEHASRALDDAERALLDQVSREGACVALHGRDHRTRWRSPRRRSELTGLDGPATGALLDRALSDLSEQVGLRPRVFVAPYNRFAAGQWPALAERFAVVGGGPESIRLLGIQSTPQWRGEAVYLPAYPPLYGRAAEVLPAAEQSIARAQGLWTPIVLHWGWEADAGWHELERLAARLAPHAVDWSAFLVAVDRSR
jgi:peptidoglycan/xylan/chitin deacetylase (PgdA/CDA1 family)